MKAHALSRFRRPGQRWISLFLISMAATAQGASPGDYHALFTGRAEAISADFPTIAIEGRTTESLALRDLYWLHVEKLNPMATLWDEWLLPPTIWPATTAARAYKQWRETLLSRNISPQGYVATHQHASIAHQQGWPFPFWGQGAGVFGWHFSFHNTIGKGWRPEHINSTDGWSSTGLVALGVKEKGLHLRTTEPAATLTAPAFRGDVYQAPFVQIRWNAPGLGADAMPYLEWLTEGDAEYSPDRRFYLEPPAGEGDKIEYTMIPLYLHPQWKDTVTGLRLHLDNSTTDTEIIFQAMFAQYDTRHNVNNQSYVTACIDYYNWTGDISFLRENIERMRLAMLFMESEFGTDKDGIVTMPWVGHEGTTGITYNEDGSVKMLHGRGVGNNYWDLMPFGRQDSYATMRHYHAALKMAELEQLIAEHPGWNIPVTPLARPADHWQTQADQAKANGNRLFWNEDTGRFTLGVDADGNQADYGYTFINLEAIYYNFATDEHARAILDWIDGHRTVSTDTSQGDDIYRWRFAPRSSTLRNIDHYGWFWNGAKNINYGDQVQDGGAVLGFSYHDIMARLRVLGPDNAAQRLEEILAWYAEVTADGGYREYYAGGKNRGNLQGGNVPGGLGLDREFFESVMVPTVMLDGFAGFVPQPDGVAMRPQLPASWPGVTITNITWRGQQFDYAVKHDSLTLTRTASDPRRVEEPVTIYLPNGWRVESGNVAEPTATPTDDAKPATVRWTPTHPLKLAR